MISVSSLRALLRQNAAKARGEKIRELFAFFTLTPEQSEDHADADEAEAACPTPLAPAVAEKTPRRQTVRRPPPLFRSITGIPLPISGRYGNMPPEVAAAAMGKIIHLLQCLVKYLKVTYPHPMVFNGSFSTIGNTSEGAGCHTLYPDGSPGFARAVEMLHENVSFLCSTQGVAPSALHPTDILGNLLVMYQSTRLGTLCDGAVVSSPAKRCVCKTECCLVCVWSTLTLNVRIVVLVRSKVLGVIRNSFDFAARTVASSQRQHPDPAALLVNRSLITSITGTQPLFCSLVRNYRPPLAMFSSPRPQMEWRMGVIYYSIISSAAPVSLRSRRTVSW